MSGDQELVFNLVTCPDCGHSFPPIAKQLEESETSETKSSSNSQKKTKVQPAEKLKTKTRKMAEVFSVIAGILFVISIICLLFALKKSIANSEADFIGWLLTGSFLSTALWIFLIAQIIHIRANTEK